MTVSPHRVPASVPVYARAGRCPVPPSATLAGTGETAGDFIAQIDPDGIYPPGLHGCDRILVLGPADTEAHVVQGTADIESGLERQGGLEYGDMVVKAHVQVLDSTYGRLIAVYLHKEGIDVDAAVLHRDIY